MAGENRRIAGQVRQRLQAAEHVVDVAAGEVGAAATLQEQGVAGDQPTVEQEALAARRVARGVQQLDVDVADEDLVAVFVRGQLTARDPGDLGHPVSLVDVDVHRNADPLEQLGQPLQREPHHRAADVVGVVVGHQHPGQMHAVGLEDVHEILRRVGGIHHDGVTGLPVPDQVGEVAHLLGDHVAGREVAARQQLPEVETLGVGHTGQRMHPRATESRSGSPGTPNETLVRLA